jgi:hypothetical protein
VLRLLERWPTQEQLAGASARSWSRSLTPPTTAGPSASLTASRRPLATPTSWPVRPWSGPRPKASAWPPASSCASPSRCWAHRATNRGSRSLAVRSPSAFPGSGTASPPGGEIGDHLEPFETPNSLPCDAGKALVSRRSGKSELVVAHRLAGNRHLANAVQPWAFCAVSRSTWAREFYDAQRARGRATTPPCAPSATAGWRCSGIACAAASPPTRPSTSPTATGRSARRPEPSTVER